MKKQFVGREKILDEVSAQLEKMQKEMLEKARLFREENTHEIDEYRKFTKFFGGKGGFAMSHWCGSPECEEKVKSDTKATIRCIPFDHKKEKGKCIVCGGESEGRVIFAKAY